MNTVYFVQHGKALPKDVDEKRPLSADGRDEVRRVANHLRQYGMGIRNIFHSGKLRAAQTAELFAEILGVSHVSEMSGMDPTDNPSKLIDQINEDAVMYVGHLPNIQDVVGHLIANGGGKSVVKFQNSAVACIEMDGVENGLRWFITANMCHQIAQE